ncbi:hypothetical protein L7F22_036757 [Adiantum nelumboides]|nr:hypothetical protein [Adiantum nelumboides]
MASPRSAARRLSCCFTSLQSAEKQLVNAKQLIAMRKREDVEAALAPLECALELKPDWEAALELKARVLLYLKRFKDVVDMLHEYVPSLRAVCPSTPSSPSSSFSSRHTPVASAHSISAGLPDSPMSSSFKEKARLLVESSGNSKDDIFLLSPFKQCVLITKLSHKLSTSLSFSPSRLSMKKAERQQQWRYPVLGQACFHLGMLEDAMILLQKGKRSASDISRKKSNGMREDNFCSDASNRSTSTRSASLAESELVVHLLGNVKFLLRRRAAAMAALEAGLYAESARHFSKIIDGRKGNTPQGFIADCYLHRAIAYQATGRVVDAISDCNRCLVMSPYCSVQALSVRASLYEMVRCYSDCMLDLQQLKIIYEASLRYQSMLPELSSAATPACTSTIWQPHISHIDFAGGLEYINSKITSTRQRLSSGSTLDAHTILDMPRNCTMADVERAYLLISLKHKADKAAQFVERRDFAIVHDKRDMATVKEEARASALRLSQLIHKAYTKLLSSIAEDETEEQNEMLACGELDDEDDRQLGLRRSGLKTREVCLNRGDGNDEGTRLREESEESSKDRREACRSILMHAWHGVESSAESSSDGEAMKSDEEEEDGCDFCQPFGGLSSTTLASALSQALSGDLPLFSMTCPSERSGQLACHSQPLPVP